MSANCAVILEKAENVIVVPKEAIQTSNNTKYVVVVNEDGSTENVTVETGISNDAYTEIKSGLLGTETVAYTVTTTTTNGSTNRTFMNGGNGAQIRVQSQNGGQLRQGGM